VGAACGEVEFCEPSTWATWTGDPVAAEGIKPAEGPTVLVSQLGPFSSDVQIETTEIGQAPGWGCDSPAVLDVGVWAGERGDNPTAALRGYEVAPGVDLGNGFETRSATLKEPVMVQAGQDAWVALGIRDNICGAKASSPTGGSWRWTDESGWHDVDGALVMRAHGCTVTDD
jgi:hypothetical protein